MKTLLTLLLATLCAATSYGQTIKSLGFNSTNGQIVAATNVVWTNSFSFSTSTVAAQVRTNLGLGWSALTNTNAANFRSAIELGIDNSVEFNQVVVTKNDLTTGLYSEGGIVIEADGTNYSSVFVFSGDESVNLQARARTNLGIPLAASQTQATSR